MRHEMVKSLRMRIRSAAPTSLHRQTIKKFRKEGREREKRENAISDQLRQQNGQTLEQMVPSDEQAKRKLRITSI